VDIERTADGSTAAVAATISRRKETAMPLVQVKVVEGVFNGAQKRQMVEGLAETMVSIGGENIRQLTWVLVEEVRSGNWGIGGSLLTADAVKALAAQALAS
jgi:4-oxalocrotonate tautomerase